MERFTVLIGLFFMSLAILILTWPLVEKEALPVILMAREDLFLFVEVCAKSLRGIIFGIFQST